MTTAGGDWLGTLAAAPAPDADGLTAQVPLTDTADLWASGLFREKVIAFSSNFGYNK